MRVAALVCAWMLLSRCTAASAKEPAGGNLVQVMAAARDIAAFEVLAREDMVVAKVPAALVTTSAVKPDSASYIEKQTTSLPIAKGDLLLWSAFEVTQRPETSAGCRKLAAEGATAAEQIARARKVILSR